MRSESLSEDTVTIHSWACIGGKGRGDSNLWDNALRGCETGWGENRGTWAGNAFRARKREAGGTVAGKSFGADSSASAIGVRKERMARPEFGNDGGHKQCILHWILWLLTIHLAIYTLFKCKKNKEELEKLFREEENWCLDIMQSVFVYGISLLLLPLS